MSSATFVKGPVLSKMIKVLCYVINTTPKCPLYYTKYKISNYLYQEVESLSNLVLFLLLEMRLWFLRPALDFHCSHSPINFPESHYKFVSTPSFVGIPTFLSAIFLYSNSNYQIKIINPIYLHCFLKEAQNFVLALHTFS